MPRKCLSANKLVQDWRWVRGFRRLGRTAFHPGLQNQDCGHAVDGLAAFLDGKFGLAQQAVGFGRGETFVPKMNGEAEAFLQVVGEGPHLFRLGSFRAAHAQRESDHDLPYIVVTNHALEVGEVVALVPALESFKTLGGDAEEIGDGDADAAGADVEAEYAAMGSVSFGGRIVWEEVFGRPGQVGRHGLDYRPDGKSHPRAAELRSADSRGRLSPHVHS